MSHEVVNSEVARRQYLEAMGIATFASRYCLPNALPTPACEWDATPPATPSHGERLHALIDDAHQAEADRRADAPPEASADPAALKALLHNDAAPSRKASPEDAAPVADAPAAPSQPLRFTLSCVCLGGRWLSLHEGEISPAQRRLLANICRAAGMDPSALSAWHTLDWPPLAGGPEPADPVAEAREGLRAFIDGAASRNDWAPTRLLWWADDDASPLAQVLGPEEDSGRIVARALAHDVWQAPSLASLLHDGSAKRALWPALQALGEQWREEAGHGRESGHG